jgi:cytochrome c-type biogenesis protein CcmF
MSVELGHFALVLALLLALAQATLPLVGAARGNAAWMAVATPAALGELFFIAIAFLALMYAYVTSDFSVAVVADNSNSAMPPLFKAAATWGNHEGSLLLWVMILSIFGAAVAVFGVNLPPVLKARVLSVQAMIAVGFLAFMLFTSNPFARLDPAPADGADLNPLLQDPGLAFHPPLLYFGYVGFSMAFSFAVAALIEGRVDAAWARWVRPWTLAAWIALTGGIAGGSWWSYYELGWGGWWAWDPVENASFMPWLLGTALLHSAIVVEKRDALKSWTILLAILTFAMSLIGTFLVRSGVLTSVHAFASDPARGGFILLLLVIAVGGSLALFALRAPTLKDSSLFQPVSREGALIVNNLLLCVGTAVVFLGTFFPLFADVLGAGAVSVGSPWYDLRFIPFAVLLIVITAVGPFLRWKRGDLPGALPQLTVAAVVTLAAAALVWRMETGGSLMGVLGVALGIWLFVGTLVELGGRMGLLQGPRESWRRARQLPRAAIGMTLAHAGLAIAILGMTGSTAWREERILSMRPGDTVTLAGYDYRFGGVVNAIGPNYTAARGVFTVTRNGNAIATLYPEKRVYAVQGMPTTEAAIHTTGLADIYAVIDSPDASGALAVHIYHQPLVPWIWGGALLMVLGGVVSLSDRRLRIGIPVRRRLAAAANPAT